MTRAGWYALLLVACAQALSLLDRQILSILAPSISADLGIGDAEIGLLYGTVFALFYALFSLPLGRLVDGWIRTRLLAICLAMWSLAAGMAAFASSFTLLAVSRLGVGIAEGATQPAANSIIFDDSPRAARHRHGRHGHCGGTGPGPVDGARRRGRAMVGYALRLGWSTVRPLRLADRLPRRRHARLSARLLIFRMREPRRGGLDGITSPATEAHPFKASAAVLGTVTPGSNWFMLWHRNAGARQWAINLIGLALICLFCWSMVQLTQAYSPRPPLAVLGGALDPHVLQWFVMGFGLFVILNLFQSFKLTDPPTYKVVLSPSLMLLMVIGGLQTAINYGVMGFTPSFLVREHGLSMAETGLQFGALPAALGIAGPVIAGPLTDWPTRTMGAKARVWLILFALGILPFFGIWTYSAESATSFYLRFSVYSIILTLWLPPLYAQLLELVLPRMRGITFATYTIVMTLPGLGLSPYFVGIVSDRNGGDLGQAIMLINVAAPAIVVLLIVVLLRVNRDEASIVARARAAGEPI